MLKRLLLIPVLICFLSLNVAQATGLGILLKQLVQQASKSAISEAGKTAVDWFKELFNKNDKIAQIYKKPQLRNGTVKNNERQWVLSPVGTLTKDDINAIAQALKSIDQNREQRLTIGNSDQVVTTIGNVQSQQNIAITSHNQTGGVTAQTYNNQTYNIESLVVIPPSAKDPKPKLFSITDPGLKQFRRYLIPKDIGTTFNIPDNCSSAPCFIVKLRGIDLSKSPPTVHFSVGGWWDNIYEPNAAGFGMHPTLKEGCGFKFRSGYYDLVFEIISDRVTSLEAWAAVFDGTLEKGHVIMQGVCPQ